MTTIILNGCYGRMGKVITELVNDKYSDKLKIVAGIDKNFGVQTKYPVFNNILTCNIMADVVVDFSHPSALDDVLNFGLNNNIALVIATTGLSPEQKTKIAETSKRIPVFFSANMSIGINLISKLAKQAAVLLQDDFDIEILERHHNQKVDAPSGTAYLLADAINSVLKEKDEYVYDRHSVSQKRSKREIGISSIRGGTIAGDHDIIFAGNNEIVEISHHAQSREIFAAGAIRAAIYMKDKQAGLYDMNALIEEYQF